MADIVNVGFRVDTSQIEKGYNRFNKMGSAAGAAEKKTSGALGSIGKSAGQAGIQIQQFVGQVQMGTSPLVAMSQQAADLGIVLGAPLLGAITGIAASIGTVFLPALFDADDATDKLKETLEAIDKVAVQTAGGTFTLTEEIARLAKVSETAANAQIALSITEATQAIDLARDSANEAVSELDNLLNGFDVVSTPGMINKLNAAMDRTGLSASELLKTTNLYSTGLTQLRSFSDSLNSSLGTTTEQSIKLIRAVSDFKSGGNVSALADTFSDISLSTSGATKEFQSLAVQLNSLSLTTEKSEAVLTLLKETMGDLDGILSSSESAVNDIIDSFTAKTAALHINEVQMAKNIALQAAGADATDTEKKKIESAIDAYYRKLNAIRAEEKAQRKANREREKAIKLAEKEAADAFTDLISGTDTVDLFALNQSKAYDAWIESISTTSTRIADLRAEIEKAQKAMSTGKLPAQVGKEYIADLSEQIDELNQKDNPFDNLASGATQSLSAIQRLATEGTDAYKQLERAINAVNLAQSLATGNIAGAIGAGVGLLMTFDKEIKDFSADIQANQNLNVWGEKADSIAEATDITAQATEKLVGINSDMLDALKVVRQGISGASGLIARDKGSAQVNVGGLGIIGNPLTDTGIGKFLTKGLDLNILNILSGGLLSGLGKALGGLLGGKSKVTGEGIRIIGGYITDLTNDVLVQSYQDVSYKKWRFGGTKHKRAIKNLSGGIRDQFSLVFGSIIDSVAAGAGALGISDQKIQKTIDEFRLGTSEINLKGMSQSRQQEALEAYFSRVFNSLAVNVIPFLDEFQKAGEELGETLSRLATEVSVAEYLVDNLGVTFADKMANPKAFAQAADNLATLAGGAEKLIDQVSSFTDTFASDTQKFDIYQDALSEALNEVGLTLPSSAQGFFDLMGTLDGTTEAGQRQIATLLSLTDTADGYFRILDRSVGKFREAAKGLFEVTEASRVMSIESSLAAARLGDFSLAEQLDLSGIAPSTKDFSSRLEFNLARAETAAKLNELADLQSGQVSVDEKQLTVLEQIRDKLGDNATMDQSKVAEKIDNLGVTMKKLITESNDYLRRSAYQGA